MLSGLAHAAGDLLGVALNTGDESVRESVCLAAVVDGLDDDDLFSECLSPCPSTSLVFPFRHVSEHSLPIP